MGGGGGGEVDSSKGQYYSNYKAEFMEFYGRAETGNPFTAAL